MRDPHDYEVLLRRLQLFFAAGLVAVGALMLLVNW